MIQSRWFPLALAATQTVLFGAIVLGEYRYYAQAFAPNTDWRSLFRRELARPVAARWCGMHSATSWTSAMMSWNLGAVLIARTAHTLATFSLTCADDWNSARGTLYTACCVPIAWFPAGPWLQRVARRQARPRFARCWQRWLVGVPYFVCAWVGLMAAVLALPTLFLDARYAASLAGGAFWCGVAALWAAERMGVWSPRRGSSPTLADCGMLPSGEP